MKITINNYDELLQFIKRDDVSAVDALNIFSESINVVCITFIDAITGKNDLNKSEIIKETEMIINALKADPYYKPKTILFF